MSRHTSPFGKHPVELVAVKSNKIFTFAEVPSEKSPRGDDFHHLQVRVDNPGVDDVEKCCNEIEEISGGIHRPVSRMSSFYNGYNSSSSQTPNSPRSANFRRSSPEMRQNGRGSSPEMRQHGRGSSPEIRQHGRHDPTSDDDNWRGTNSQGSLPSPRRDSQSDCTEANCLNLFHQHNLNKSPRATLVDWGKSSHRSLSRTPTPTKNITLRDSVVTSRDSVVTSRDSTPESRDSGVTSRTPSPSKEDRLSQAIRDMEKYYHVGLVHGEEMLTGLGQSVNVREMDKAAMLQAHNIAPLFAELGDEPVTIDRVLAAWEEKGLKDSSDRSVLEFLKRVASMSVRGENLVLPQILSYNIEAVLISNEIQSDSLRESAIAAFKSVITTLQTNLAQVQYDMDAMNMQLERRSEELERVMHESEVGLDLEHKKSDEKLRVQKEVMRQSMSQIERENEQKTEKLNNQMDGIIKRTDREIKNLKNEEANLKKIISERDVDLKLTKKYLHEAQNELDKFDELQDAYKILIEEYHKIRRAMELNQRKQCEEQENNDELRRFWEEGVEENKKLKDQLDELHAKFSACKMKLEKAEKNAMNAAKRLKKAQQKLQDQTGDTLAVDQRQKMRQRLSMAVPMFTKEADPNMAPTIDTELEDSLNDEILDSESNNVLELTEEVWRLQEEVENRDFEIERYAKILLRQHSELDILKREKEADENDNGAVPDMEVTEVRDLDNMVHSEEVTVEQEKVVHLETMLKENKETLGETTEQLNETREQLNDAKVGLEEAKVGLEEAKVDLEEAKVGLEEAKGAVLKKDEEIECLTAEKRELEEKNTKLEMKYQESVSQLEEQSEQRSTNELVDTLQDQLAILQEQVELLNGALELSATEIEELESQLEESSKVINSYEDTLTGNQSLLDQCKEEFSVCKVEFEKANEQLEELTEEIRAVKQERAVDIEQHKYKVSELESTIQKMEEERTASTARAAELTSLQDKSIVSGDLIKRLQNTVDEQKVELENTQTALDEAETECTELKEQIAQKEGMGQDMEAKEEINQQLSSELDQIKELFNEQLQKLDAVEQEKSELAQKVLEKEGAHQKLSSELDQINELCNEQLQKLDAVEEENGELAQKVLELGTSREEKETLVEQLNEKLAVRTQEAARLESEKCELADELAAARNKLTESVENMHTHRAAREKEKEELEHILESKEDEIETLKVHLEQVETDYEALLDSLNKETDDRVSELQNQLEITLQETAAISSSLKSQLKDLGQQLVVLSGDRDRYYKESCKLRSENDRLVGEKELLIGKVEDLKAVRDTLEVDIEQQVAEYQDMMKSCANLQQENQDYIKDLEHAAFELDEKTTQLEQTEKEKEEIIQLFEDKIREKERALESSILEKSELEGRAKETEVELCKTRDSRETLDDVKRSLEQQLAAVINSLDDLTERYEIENSILEEKVVESINEVKEVEQKAEENLEEKLEEQREKMYEEFRKEMEEIKVKHEAALGATKEETSSAMVEFKRKCEKKMKDIKDKYKEELDSKEKVMSDLKGDMSDRNKSYEDDITTLKESFAHDKAQLIDTLASDKDKLLDKIHQMTEDKITQLEETHRKDSEVHEERLRNVQTTCVQLEKEVQDAKERLRSTTERLQNDIDKITRANASAEASYKAEITDLKLGSVKKENELSRLEETVSRFKEDLDQKQSEIARRIRQIEDLTAEYSQEISDLLAEHVNEKEELNLLHGEELKSIVEKNCGVVREMERKNLSERKELVSEYNELIESMKTEKEEEVKILTKQYEDEKRVALRKKEDLVAALEASQEVVREKDREIGSLNEEIFTVQEENVKARQEFEHEIEHLETERETLETERETLISAHRKKEAKLLEELDDVRESSFVEMENTAAEVAQYKEKCEQLEGSRVERALYDKARGKVAVLMATLRSEQAVSQERARQVSELMDLKNQLECQLATLRAAMETEKTHLMDQLASQHEQDLESRDELIRYYKSVQCEVERRLDVVVSEHAQCHNMRRKIHSLKQQLAVEKTAQNPRTDLSQRLQTSVIQTDALEKQVNNLQRSNTKLENTVTRLIEENADLVERLNVTEHQIHLALQETIKTKSQKVAICKVLDNVVNTVMTTAAA